MIVGITGTDGAGKGTVVDYLIKEKGFVHFSARALLIEEIEKRGLPVDRNQMRLVANDLRKLHGNDYVVRFYLERAYELPATARVVIESIRAIAEAQTLKAAGGILLAVDADQSIRYERVQARRSESDKVSFEQFVAHEALEMNDPDPHGMQKAKVIAMADYVLYNNGSFEELREATEAVLKKISESGSR